MKPPLSRDLPPGEPDGNPGPKAGRRRTLVVLGAGIVAAGAAAAWGTGLIGGNAAKATEVVVYKSPACGCCGEWVKHLERSGFDVSVHNVDDVIPIKEANGLPDGLESCHTALVDGYVVEGHVPADLVMRMLRERPAIVGLAVPGMPASAPGMDDPSKEPYDVLAFDKQGKTTVYARR